MSVYLVIPAFNEEKRLPELISQLASIHPLERIIVADDGSKVDVSRYLPKKVYAVRHRVNLGKGAALKTGVEYALSLGATQIILIDADGQHDPQEIPTFIKLLKNNQVVFGSRYIGEGMPVMRLVGNRLLNKATSFLFNLELHDVWCGYRAFHAKVYPKIKWDASDYSVDVEMAIKVGKNKLKHQEHFIGTIYHQKGQTGTSIIDGIKLLAELIIWKITL